VRHPSDNSYCCRFNGWMTAGI